MAPKTVSEIYSELIKFAILALNKNKQFFIHLSRAGNVQHGHQ